MRNNPLSIEVRARGGRGGATGNRAVIPLQPLEKTTLEQCEEERMAERSWYGLTTAPVPHPLARVDRGTGNRLN